MPRGTGPPAERDQELTDCSQATSRTARDMPRAARFRRVDRRRDRRREGVPSRRRSSSRPCYSKALQARRSAFAAGCRCWSLLGSSFFSAFLNSLSRSGREVTVLDGGWSGSPGLVDELLDLGDVCDAGFRAHGAVVEGVLGPSFTRAGGVADQQVVTLPRVLGDAADEGVAGPKITRDTILRTGRARRPDRWCWAPGSPRALGEEAGAEGLAARAQYRRK